MSAVFADTVYFVCVVNPRESLHARAMEFASTYRGALVTTEYVLTEVANFLCRGAGRKVLLDLVQDLRADPYSTIVPGDPTLWNRGLELFASRPDKEWSLTDCISFVVMHERGLTDALTADRHFEQAGFKTLLA